MIFKWKRFLGGRDQVCGRGEIHTYVLRRRRQVVAKLALAAPNVEYIRCIWPDEVNNQRPAVARNALGIGSERPHEQRTLAKQTLRPKRPGLADRI